MAITDDKDEKLKDAESVDGEASSSEPSEALATASDSALEGADATEGEGEEGDRVATSFGSDRYVHAAFFVAGILAAYISAKTIGMAWNSLAAWPDAVRAVPQLVGFTEEQRETYSLVAGAGIGTLVVVQSYRKESVRTWAGEVAAELSKVTWPTREAVLNGTLVVVVASALATVYVTILDKIWGFLTTLVYGA
ncbi:MAG: preprotein translocase subunit SecE [Myxococcales bacterium]|nr:MAG: preprotein translocase subunit SecE [Myxococcales bacterium]